MGKRDVCLVERRNGYGVVTPDGKLLYIINDRKRKSRSDAAFHMRANNDLGIKNSIKMPEDWIRAKKMGYRVIHVSLVPVTHDWKIV